MENERRPRDARLIDDMLAHAPKDRVEGAYNRAAYIEHRRELAQDWANILLDGMPAPAEIVAAPRRPLSAWS